jgi:hypothetical protein
MILAKGVIVQTANAATVVEKAVNFVKDVFGVQDNGAHEVVPQNVMRFDHHQYVTRLNVYDDYIRPATETAAQLYHRQLYEPRQKTALELNAESAWQELNG